MLFRALFGYCEHRDLLSFVQISFRFITNRYCSEYSRNTTFFTVVFNTVIDGLETRSLCETFGDALISVSTVWDVAVAESTVMWQHLNYYSGSGYILYCTYYGVDSKKYYYRIVKKYTL